MVAPAVVQRRPDTDAVQGGAALRKRRRAMAAQVAAETSGQFASSTSPSSSAGALSPTAGAPSPSAAPSGLRWDDMVTSGLTPRGYGGAAAGQQQNAAFVACDYLLEVKPCPPHVRCKEPDACPTIGMPLGWCSWQLHAWKEGSKQRCAASECPFYHPSAQQMTAMHQALTGVPAVAQGIVGHTVTDDEVRASVRACGTAGPLLHALRLELCARYRTDYKAGAEEAQRLVTEVLQRACSQQPGAGCLSVDPCVFYIAGACNVKKSQHCVGEHDAVPLFLMPQCPAYALGCTDPACRFTHSMCRPDAEVCEDFARGNCHDRLLCTKRHVTRNVNW